MNSELRKLRTRPSADEPCILASVSIIRAFEGKSPLLGNRVFVADNAALTGDVELEDDVSIWYGAVLRGDVGKIRIGARSNIQDNATIHMTWGMSDAVLGCDVIVGHNAVVHGARIGDGALVGMGSVIMDNASVGRGAWIAAGSVVSPSSVIPDGMLARGIPARVSRPVTEQEHRWACDAIQRYLHLAERHAAARDPAPGAR